MLGIFLSICQDLATTGLSILNNAGYGFVDLGFNAIFRIRFTSGKRSDSAKKNMAQNCEIMFFSSSVSSIAC
ncbi:hypothetical protein CHS0354_010539 [Potamilus streckersoni]|uniref:Uncharacterized protein n=1 Tax=Potamilus streckersoni TaxID=2493646 RepID=A0AAE0S679_9BIVA|nr:hypothetical protein CHS0354_010539 [Potamilus streckersoni]